MAQFIGFLRWVCEERNAHRYIYYERVLMRAIMELKETKILISFMITNVEVKK